MLTPDCLQLSTICLSTSNTHVLWIYISRNLQNAKCLNHDLHDFNSLPHGYLSKSYRWQVAIADKHIKQHRERQFNGLYTEIRAKPALFNMPFDVSKTSKMASSSSSSAATLVANQEPIDVKTEASGSQALA